MENVAINPDKIYMDEVVEKTEEGVDYFTSVSDNLVKSYTEDLDRIMQDLYKDTVLSDVSDDGIEKYMFELSNTLFCE